MKKSLLTLFFGLILVACGQENSKTGKKKTENNSQKMDFFWLTISEKDSVKFKGFSTRFFNDGKDSVVFGHYITDLYKKQEDAENPMFKRQSILVLKALAEKTKLPDTMYVQAMGIKNGTFIKKSTNFNILAGYNGTEWKVGVGNKWYSFDDFKE